MSAFLLSVCKPSLAGRSELPLHGSRSRGGDTRGQMPVSWSGHVQATGYFSMNAKV
jgi:hypothetical protein